MGVVTLKVDVLSFSPLREVREKMASHLIMHLLFNKFGPVSHQEVLLLLHIKIC